jgi:hypothetical protein
MMASNATLMRHLSLRDRVERSEPWVKFCTRRLRAPPTHRAAAQALVHHPLHGNRRGFAAADAERGDAALQVLRFERVQ